MRGLDGLVSHGPRIRFRIYLLGIDPEHLPFLLLILLLTPTGRLTCNGVGPWDPFWYDIRPTQDDAEMIQNGYKRSS